MAMTMNSKPTDQDKKQDKAFLAYIRHLPCAVCGAWADYVNGQGVSEAAHIRRASNSGTGIKPLFSAIPLCHACHSKQHQHGETALMPKEMWDFMATKYLKLWRMS